MARYATYTLRVEVEFAPGFDPPMSAEELEELQAAISHAEHIVTEALPERFYAKIDGPIDEGR